MSPLLASSRTLGKKEKEKYLEGMVRFVLKTDRSDVSVSDGRSGSNSLDRQL